MIMNDLTQLVDDALNLRMMSNYKCFATNLAAQKLKAGDERAFFAIQKYVESSELSPLLATPGLNGVLQSLFFLGNRYCVDELCGILETWPPKLVAPLLAQGSLAMKWAEIAPQLVELVEKMKQHPHWEVRKWAERFYET